MLFSTTHTQISSNKLNRAAIMACRKQLSQFFASYPNLLFERGVLEAVAFLPTTGIRLTGKFQGWAAGIVYAVANRNCYPCGVPGILNKEFTSFFGVPME